jgi:hypothetical protein
MKVQPRVWRPFIVVGVFVAITGLAHPKTSKAQPHGQPSSQSTDRSSDQSSGSDPSGAQDQAPSKDDKKADKSQDAGTVKLKIRVTDNKDKPIGNASVYVRFNESGGLFHKDKLAELNFKTNQDGSAKIPAIPQGKILIQVIATGWHTYGKWYDVDQTEQTIEIKLDPPTRWY